MLQLQIKRGVLLIGLIMLTGCEATYTLTINKDTINEKIEILDKSNSKKSRETIEIVSLLFEGKVTVIYSN